MIELCFFLLGEQVFEDDRPKETVDSTEVIAGLGADSTSTESSENKKDSKEKDKKSSKHRRDQDRSRERGKSRERERSRDRKSSRDKERLLNSFITCTSNLTAKFSINLHTLPNFNSLPIHLNPFQFEFENVFLISPISLQKTEIVQ